MDTTLSRPQQSLPQRNKLRQYRQNAGLNQTELAERIGVSQAAISLAENTGKGLGDDKWDLLAEVLGTDVLTLRGWAKIYAIS